MFRAMFKRFILNSIFLFATPGVTPSVGGGGSGSGSDSGGGTGASPAQSGAQPGSSSGTSGAGSGSSASSGSPGQGQGNIDWGTAPAHFRSAYEELKQKYEPWSRLGVDHPVASSYVQTTQGIIRESYTLGRQLGYSDTDIQEALRSDLVKTLSFLRGAAARSGGGQGNGQGQGGPQGRGQGSGSGSQLDPAVQRLIDQRLSPIEEHTNNAMVDAANQAFMTEFDRLFADGYKDDAKTMPKEVRDFFRDAVSEMFKYDDEGLKALKFQRNVQAIAKTFTEVKNRFEQALNAYHMWQMNKASGGAGSGAGSGRPGTGSAAQSQDGWSGISLDDIAQGDERAVKLIPSMR